jgi:hypothetical protein
MPPSAHSSVRKRGHRAKGCKSRYGPIASGSRSDRRKLWDADLASRRFVRRRLLANDGLFGATEWARKEIIHAGSLAHPRAGPSPGAGADCRVKGGDAAPVVQVGGTTNTARPAPTSRPSTKRHAQMITLNTDNSSLGRGFAMAGNVRMMEWSVAPCP